MLTLTTHLVPNVAEGGCESNPTGVTEHTLQERYFPPFDAAIEDDGARSVMPAYDLVDESPATQNRRSLIGILRTL